MGRLSACRDALAETAADWREPDHPPREAAVEATLEADHRFTEEAVTFALNQRMQSLSREAIEAWLGEPSVPSGAPARACVAVRHAATEPMDGLRGLVAALGLGFAYTGLVEPESPHLVPAFLDDLLDRWADGGTGEASARARVEVLPEDADGRDISKQLPAQADAFVGAARDAEEEATLRAAAVASGMPPACRLIRPPRYAVAVLDGHESEDDLEALAEDVLLHEGLSRRTVRVLWAPADLKPDQVLAALAGFRGIFPAHERTPGTLQMPQAFLKARGLSHAYGEGLEFLVSRGDPEPQQPGHLRWSEYGELGEAARWLEEHASEVLAVTSRDALMSPLSVEGLPHRPFGTLHRLQLADELESPGVASWLRQTLGLGSV